MKFLFVFLLMATSAVASNPIGEQEYEKLLNCEVVSQRFDRILEVRGVCPLETNTAYIVGYYMGKKGLPSVEVKKTKDVVGKDGISFSYKIFMTKPLYFK